MAGLRASLIGNRDLKLKLFLDGAAVAELAAEFSRALAALAATPVGRPAFALRLRALEDAAVVAKMVCRFSEEAAVAAAAEAGAAAAAEKTAAEAPLAAHVLACWAPTVAPMAQFLRFYMEAVLLRPPAAHAAPEAVLADPPAAQATLAALRFEHVVGDVLDVTAACMAAAPSCADGDSRAVFWRWIAALSALGGVLEAVVLRLWRLVPLLLREDPRAPAAREAPAGASPALTLLSVLLHRLAGECRAIDAPDSDDDDDAAPPRARDAARLAALITAVAQIFTFVQRRGHTVGGGGGAAAVPPPVYLRLLLLLRSPDARLSLAALNLLYACLNNAEEPFAHYRRLFPRICELLAAPAAAVPPMLASPCAILAQLCTRFPALNDDVRRANLDVRLVAMLEQAYRDDAALRALRQCRRDDCIADLAPVVRARARATGTLGDLIWLLSVYTGTKEEHRARVTAPGAAAPTLSYIVFEVVDHYCFLLRQTHMVAAHLRRGAELPRLARALGNLATLLGDPATTHTLYLVRALSRSVALLRTFFVECNAYPAAKGAAGGANVFIHSFPAILSGTQSCQRVLTRAAAAAAAPAALAGTLAATARNQSVVLGILANLVLDFSSFRYILVNSATFVPTLVRVYSDSPVGFNVLQVLKNYTYNENDDVKLGLIAEFGFGRLFAEMAGGCLERKVLAFDIVRNLTSGSRVFSARVPREFNRWRRQLRPELGGWYAFITATLLRVAEFGAPLDDVGDPATIWALCGNEHYASMMLAINYIEDHRYTNLEAAENLEKRERLLRIWLGFLRLAPRAAAGAAVNAGTAAAANNLNLIQVLICWILVNLTWQNELYGSRRLDSVLFKVYDTILVVRSSERDVSDDEAEAEAEAETEAVAEAAPAPPTSATQRASFLRQFGFLAALDDLIARLSGTARSPGHRFDTVMGNDLLEKARTAKNQMVELTRRDGAPPARAPHARPDINRGGEGYGYESDDYAGGGSEIEAGDIEADDEFDECWVR